MSRTTIPNDLLELLDDAALDADALARGCGMSIEWVRLRVAAETLRPLRGESVNEWRFASATLHRARRLAEVENIYDADPQLAALAADLMEEIDRLRRALAQQPR